MQAHIAYRLISYYSVVTPIFDYTRFEIEILPFEWLH